MTAEPPLTGSVTWYFAGVSGQTVHVFVIFQEFSKAAARIIEIERRPVLLTLDKEDAATLTLLPLHAKPAPLWRYWGAAILPPPSSNLPAATASPKSSSATAFAETGGIGSSAIRSSN